jgi:hypothetical protein
MVLKMIRLVLSEAKSLETSSKKTDRLEAHSDQMVLVIVRQEAGPCEQRPTQGLHSLRVLK